MAWKTVYIVVEADSIDDAEQKALEVFESEGNDVCDGKFELESGEENNKIFQIKDLINKNLFLEILNIQIQEYDAHLKSLLSKNIIFDHFNTKCLRNIVSDYHAYLSPKITHHSVLYNGITYEPVLDIKDLEKVAKKGYIVPIMFHY